MPTWKQYPYSLCDSHNSAEARDDWREPACPGGVENQNPYLRRSGNEQSYGEQPFSPVAAPVVSPHGNQSNANQGANGGSEHRKIILMKEASYAEEHIHGS